MRKSVILKTKPNATLKSKKLKLTNQDTLKPKTPEPPEPEQMPVLQKRLNEDYIK